MIKLILSLRVAVQKRLIRYVHDVAHLVVEEDVKDANLDYPRLLEAFHVRVEIGDFVEVLGAVIRLRSWQHIIRSRL